jgi:pilus assembly protein Flp/PilA
MKNIIAGLKHFINDEEGVTAIEYGLIAALIAVVIIAMVALIGTRLNCVFNRVATCLSNSAAAACTTACP